MFDELMIVGGLFWSATYIMIIRRGFKDKTFGIPFAALCANISWEAIFSFVTPHSAPRIYINYVWFALDTVIVYQFLKFGRREFTQISPKILYGIFALGLTTAFPMIMFVNSEFADTSGAYSAFGQNLMMSALFVMMLVNRSDSRGQSIYIALFKLLGTGITSIAFFTYKQLAQESSLLQFIFVMIFVYDLIYLIMIYHKSKGQNVWKRI
jgi:hypothetical protein